MSLTRLSRSTLEGTRTRLETNRYPHSDNWGSHQLSWITRKHKLERVWQIMAVKWTPSSTYPFQKVERASCTKLTRLGHHATRVLAWCVQGSVALQQRRATCSSLPTTSSCVAPAAAMFWALRLLRAHQTDPWRPSDSVASNQLLTRSSSLGCSRTTPHRTISPLITTTQSSVPNSSITLGAGHRRASLSRWVFSRHYPRRPCWTRGLIWRCQLRASSVVATVRSAHLPSTTYYPLGMWGLLQALIRPVYHLKARQVLINKEERTVFIMQWRVTTQASSPCEFKNQITRKA